MASSFRSIATQLLSAVRVTQFAAVGGVGALCDIGTLALLHGWLSVPLWLAYVPAAEVGIVVMFVLNERVTFADEGLAGLRSLGRRFLTSNLVRTGGMAVGWAVILALNEFFGVWYLLAKVGSLGAGFLVNYVLESLLTWRVHQS